MNAFYTGKGVNQVTVITGTNTTYTEISRNAFTGLTSGGNRIVNAYYYDSPSGPVSLNSLPQRKAFKFSLRLTRLDYCPRGNWGIGSHSFPGRVT